MVHLLNQVKRTLVIKTLHWLSLCVSLAATASKRCTVVSPHQGKPSKSSRFCAAHSSGGDTITKQRRSYSESTPLDEDDAAEKLGISKYTARPPSVSLESCLKITAPHTLEVASKHYMITRVAEATLPCCRQLSDSDVMCGATAFLSVSFALRFRGAARVLFSADRSLTTRASRSHPSLTSRGGKLD